MMDSNNPPPDIASNDKQGEAAEPSTQQSSQEEVVEETVTFVTADAVVPVEVTASQIIQHDQANGSQANYEESCAAQVVEQPTEMGEASDLTQTANDQEMGLAVAILELIGSRPHIEVNPPTGSNPQEGVNQEFVDIAVRVRDTTQPDFSSEQADHVSPPQSYPVTLHQTGEGQITGVAVATAAVDEVGETEAMDGEQRDADDEKNKGSGKRKHGKSKGGKKKTSDEQTQDQPSKKKKKTDKKSDDTASTSSEIQTKDKAAKNFLCTLCSASFNRKDNLKVHIKSKHNAELPDSAASSRTKCLNPTCEESFYHKTQMLKHMEEEHGLEVQKKEMEFKSLEEFKKWKTVEETKKYVFFSSYRGPSANKSGKGSHLYFKCQKDGPNRPHRKLGEPDRKTERRNRKGSVKTGLLCPARMICKVDGKTGKVKLTYIYSHTHPISCTDTEHQPVPEALKKELMEKLAMGTPVKQLYKDLRKVSADQGPKSSPHAVDAVHFITLRSLDLLKHRVDMSRRPHHEERTSILLLVEKLKAEPYNPILLYKPHGSVAVVGDESLMHLPFADDLSVLALQTDEQMKFLKEGGAKVLYVDTTYASNPTDLKIISLVVPDSHQQGYGVAHLIANRIDEHLLYYFIKAIKERCGEGFEPSVIMTDEDNTGYGVFQAVFPGVTFTHLFSKWHIHRAWLKRMNRDIQNTSLRQELYHGLVLMMEEQSMSKFNEMASNFVSHYATKSQTFTEYFVEMYRARPELWAMCFREQRDADVIFMNNYHSNLKAFYGQKRKASKRIDSLVNILLDVDKDASWKRVKRVFEACSDPAAKEFSSHHDRGMIIAEDQIEDCSGERNAWLVPSYSDKDDKHKVTKLYNVCLDDHCYLKCLELSCFGLCHHLYECSCYDEIDICQHIHRVHSMRVSQRQVPQSLQCTPAADLGAYVEIHYMDEDETVGVATQNVQTSEVVSVVEEASTSDAAESGSDQVGTLQSRLQHLVNLLGSRQVDDILISHVTGTVDQLISTCEAASNPATQT
ncbi:uncharacterized protein [Amphiura filiformis]|uniref:uncharacterized protein n=1 Tax=Amphiura filiformis TaxID=82378 RepID=UPI003B21D6A3